MSQSWSRPDGECVYLPMPLLPIDRRTAQKVWDAALCTQVDPELFFPTQGETGQATTAEAKAICAQCEVQQLCLETFGTLLDHGIVGGKSAVERRGMKQERRRARKDAA